MMMFHFYPYLTLICGVLSVPQSTTIAPSDRIVNGKPSKGYTWIASLQTSDGSSFCGGALIAPTIILTAGHCIHQLQASQIKVQIGSKRLNDLKDLTQRYDVESVHLPSEFELKENPLGKGLADLQNDIGVLKLSKASSQAVLKVDLNDVAKHPGDSVTALGYGRLAGAVANSDPRPLNEVELQIAPENFCENVFKLFNEDQSLCVIGTEDNLRGSTCKGDSGSPLLFQNTAIGVVSYGKLGCTDGVSVFTRVSTYSKFIKQFL